MSASLEKPALVVTLVLFGTLTAVAVWVDGFRGTVDAITFNWASLQIYIDLVIAAVIISVWIHRDAHKSGRNPWPWIVATAVVGMFSPLVYLLTRDTDR